MAATAYVPGVKGQSVWSRLLQTSIRALPLWRDYKKVEVTTTYHRYNGTMTRRVESYDDAVARKLIDTAKIVADHVDFKRRIRVDSLDKLTTFRDPFFNELIEQIKASRGDIPASLRHFSALFGYHTLYRLSGDKLANTEYGESLTHDEVLSLTSLFRYAQWHFLPLQRNVQLYIAVSEMSLAEFREAYDAITNDTFLPPRNEEGERLRSEVDAELTELDALLDTLIDALDATEGE